jgi:hypothetical protein
MHTCFWSGTLKEEDNFENLGVVGGIGLTGS